MKKYLYLLMMMVVCASFVACGDDDDDDNNIVPSGEAKKLIGGWYASYYGYGENKFLFLSDGTCLSEDHYAFSHIGSWKYDDATKQLATTMDGETWSVSMLTSNAWTGFSTKYGESITYKRDDRLALYFFGNYINRCEISLGDRGKEALVYIHIPDIETDLFFLPENMSISTSAIKATNVESRIWDMSETGISVFSGNISLINYGKENAKLIVEGTLTATGERFKKEYGANLYIKDGKVVSINS